MKFYFQKMENIQKKNFRDIDLFHFTSFLAWTILNFLVHWVQSTVYIGKQFVYKIQLFVYYFQILVDIINNDNLGDTIIRSRIWIPNCFRIITASLTSVECRSWIIRTPRFLNGRCIKDLDLTSPDENLEVLWLDLLLSLTSFDVSFKSCYFLWHS